MIFKGRKPVRKVLFFLGLQELETVESMKYLGVDFAASWSWLNTKVRLAEKARARLACVTKAIYEGLTLDSGENLWHTGSANPRVWMRDMGRRQVARGRAHPAGSWEKAPWSRW